MHLTIDNSVFISAFKNEEQSAVCRELFEWLKANPCKLYQPPCYLFEVFRAFNTQKQSGGIDSDYLNNLFPFQGRGEGLGINIIQISDEDAMKIITFSNDEISNDRWRSKLLTLKPAADMEYLCIAHKTTSLLITIDAPMLELGKIIGDCYTPEQFLRIPPQ